MAAENVLERMGGEVAGDASMRPRRMAAENARGRRGGPSSGGGASMRPRRMAAENVLTTPLGSRIMRRFNEAAAHGRGKREGVERPQDRRARFNEAAAHGRGKHAARSTARAGPHSFNEAAAHGRGKPGVRPGRGAAVLASMRPRRMAAENMVSASAIRTTLTLQ